MEKDQVEKGRESLRIFMAASEMVPWAKVGGLADVMGSLPGELARLGHKVWVAMPYYRQAQKSPLPCQPLDVTLSVPIGNKMVGASVFSSPLDDVTVYLIQNDSYYDREEVYGDSKGDYPDNAERFGFFSRAVLALVERLGLEVDIFHCHDWQSALIPFFMREEEASKPVFSRTKIFFTIHNLGYQGLFPKEVMASLGLPERSFHMEGIEFYGKMNFLKAGLISADAITTVSKKYAQEIQTPEYGCGLQGVLNKRREHLHGILNGVDYSLWDPQKDSFIASSYSPKSLTGKKACKADLIKKAGLKIGVDKALVGMIGRLSGQKGYDLLLETIGDIMTLDCGLVILGKGEEKYETALQQAAKRFKGKMVVKIAFDDAFAHKIEAGSDLFLMPSQYEPCGLNQIYSLKYGTIPIVRATGGLDDTIMTYDPATGTGNGFKFDSYHPRDLFDKLKEALIFFHQKNHWQKLIKNAMKCDFSWAKSARQYEELYYSYMNKE